MKYQLVLQWPANSIKDYDSMIEIEATLIKTLSKQHELDGHDAGSGEMNIFIHTDDPVAAFAEVTATLGTQDFWVDARVAFRELPSDHFTILWPIGFDGFKIA
jgi:hypothetical protein